VQDVQWPVILDFADEATEEARDVKIVDYHLR
jgi:plasmid maintenance system killer protein